MGPSAAGVHALRRHVLNHPALAALILAAALLLRVLVPAGFMPVNDHGRVVIAICSGTSAGAMTMPGMKHHDSGGDMAKSPCAFADLALPMQGGADPVLLVAALAFVALLALVRAVPVAPRGPRNLRPPLRGPPAIA